MTTFYSTGYSAKDENPMYTVGKKLKTVHCEMFVDASELTDGDKFVLAGPLSPQDRVHRVFSPNASPALTAATNNDLGFYRKDATGALVAVDADILWDGVTLASALSTRDLLLGLNSSLDQTKNIATLLGLQQDKEYSGGLYLVLTMNTKSTADGTLDLDIVIEEATTY